MQSLHERVEGIELKLGVIAFDIEDACDDAGNCEVDDVEAAMQTRVWRTGMRLEDLDHSYAATCDRFVTRLHGVRERLSVASAPQGRVQRKPRYASLPHGLLFHTEEGRNSRTARATAAMAAAPDRILGRFRSSDVERAESRHRVLWASSLQLAAWLAC